MADNSWRARYPLLNPAYLAADQGLMRKVYPAFRLVVDGGTLSFRGPLQTNWGSTFNVEIRLPPRYPEEEPTLWVLSPRLPDGTLHRYSDGRICAHASPFVAWQTMAATMVSVFAGWLLRFDRQRLHGVSWEVPIAGPGEEIHVEPGGQVYLIRPGEPR